MDKKQIKNSNLGTPSPEAIRAMFRFMMKTSMPRIIAEELAKKRDEKEVN